MSNRNKYIKTLIQLTELKPSSYSYTPFCTFGSLPSRKVLLPCNLQTNTAYINSIQCVNCIYNKEDISPDKTRELLLKTIEISEES